MSECATTEPRQPPTSPRRTFADSRVRRLPSPSAPKPLDSTDPSKRKSAWGVVVKLFWMFVLCSVVGLVLEETYHFLVFHELQGREGLVLGPFSPLYGAGGVCMVLLSKALEGKPPGVLFLLFALAGGTVEFLASLILQAAFGIVAWDYTGTWLSLDGRTNGFFMCAWGVLGLLCVYVLVPAFNRRVLPLVERIPQALTVAFMAFVALDVAFTVVAFNCWYHRTDGEVPDTPVQTFFAVHFDDGYMEDRFEVMSLHPNDASRH